MGSMNRLRKSGSTIFWAFPALMLTYILFLSDLGDIFDGVIRRNAYLAGMDRIMSSVNNLQVIALIAAALLVSCALAFQAGASPRRYLRFVPLGLVLIPVVLLLFSWRCIFGVASGEACVGPAGSGGWGNLVFPPLLLGLMVTAYAVSTSEIGGGVLRVSLALLALVAVGMVIEWIDAVAWGAAAWSVDQATVARLATSYGRSLWPGDWHITLLMGLALMTVCILLVIRAAWRSLPAFWEKPATAN
jgi:hypothetical protein